MLEEVGIELVYQNLKVSIEEGLADLVIDRPYVRNAISLELVDELDHCLDQLKMDNKIKVIRFSGANGTFISGGDLEQFLSVREKAKSYPMLMKVTKLLNKIEDYPKTYQLYANEITLPLYNGLQEEQLQRVVEVLVEAVKSTINK